MLEEIRIGSLGVIDSSTLELGPGLTVITGETGAGKTMIVTALGLLLGGRADSGAVRTGAAHARVEGVVRVGDLRRRSRPPSRRSGARSRTTGWCWPATSPPRAAPAPSSAAPRCRSPRWPSVAEPLVAVHGQSDQHRLLQARAQREALDRFGGEQTAALLAAYADLHARLRGHRARARRGGGRAPASGPARPTCCGSASSEIEAVDPQPGEDAALAAEESRLGFADTLRTAAEQAREALSSEQDQPDALATTAAARTALDGRPRPRPGGRRAGRPAGRAHLPALRPRRRRRVVRLAARDRPGPAGRRSPSAGRR